MLAVAEDVPRLRDGLGIPVPPGVAAAFTEPATHPIDDLVLRWARTHGPFVAATVAERYGLGRSVVESACRALVGPGTLVAGSFVDLPGAAGQRTDPVLPRPGAGPDQAPDARPAAHRASSRSSRSRTPASWPSGRDWTPPAAGPTRCCRPIEQLSGYAMPASAMESVILPARVANYSPGMLDELTAGG